MPMLDHFRPPVATRSSWEGFHCGWPAVIVQHLVPHLPHEFIAEPTAHLGTAYEVDVSTFDDREDEPFETGYSYGDASVATATWAPPKPTLSVETELGDEYAYEVRVYDMTRTRKLVAAVELVSPRNQDRPASRRAFITKCAALLQDGVCVAIVDLVTTMRFNLYAELLAEFDAADDTFRPDPPHTYAATCRGRIQSSRFHIDAWSHALQLDSPLPTLPLWLTDEIAVPLELEASYESTCKTLRVRRPIATTS